MDHILQYFHHIHHDDDDEHAVHHCGGKHTACCDVDIRLKYTIEHCSCGLHKISIKEAIGHDFENKEVLIIFAEKCPLGGWHIESGTINTNVV